MLSPFNVQTMFMIVCLSAPLEAGQGDKNREGKRSVVPNLPSYVLWEALDGTQGRTTAEMYCTVLSPVTVHCPKRYEHFHGSTGNGEGNPSDGRELFMLIVSRTTMKISEPFPVRPGNCSWFNNKYIFLLHNYFIEQEA
jgi:hypothetical protein